MKTIFSIALEHEYDRGNALHLAIRPAISNEAFLKNDRLLFKGRPGHMECFIEPDEALKREVSELYLWVVCLDDAFYQYTVHPKGVTFSRPFFYWSNRADGPEELEASTIDEYIRKKKREDKNIVSISSLAGPAPKNAIGCIGMTMDKLGSGEKFTIGFKVRESLWHYHIFPKAEQATWNYKIEDQGQEWQFEPAGTGEHGTFAFRSTTPIPYSRRATDRLKLVWGTSGPSQFPREQQMTLPFADYGHQMMEKKNKDSKEVVAYTPVYVHI